LIIVEMEMEREREGGGAATGDEKNRGSISEKDGTIRVRVCHCLVVWFRIQYCTGLCQTFEGELSIGNWVDWLIGARVQSQYRM
jgi:hypothetical protein